MSIDEAARATRRFEIEEYGGKDIYADLDRFAVFRVDAPGYTIAEWRANGFVSEHATEEDAQAACDRMNLISVLEELRGNPPQSVLQAIVTAVLQHDCVLGGDVLAADVYDAAIDALIAEAK